MSTACTTAVFRHSVSKGSARLVLLAMADEANDQGLLTAYRRSQSWLAKKANVDQGTVRRAIDTLVQLGEVTVLRQGDGRESSDYRLVLPDLAALDEGVQPAPPARAGRMARARNLQGQGAQPAPPIIPVLPGTPGEPGETRAEPDVLQLATAVGQSIEAAGAALFDEFWRVYPRKTDKGAARRAWAAAVRKATAAHIIEGARRYAADPNREDRYTKHASTWLNAEAWDNPALPARTGRAAIPAPTQRRDVQEGRVAL